MSDQEREQLQNKSQNKNATDIFKDSVDHSLSGSPQELTRGGGWTKALTLVIVVIGLLLLAQCSG